MAKTPTLFDFCRDIEKDTFKAGNIIADNDGEVYVVRHVIKGIIKATKYGYDNPLYTFKKSHVHKTERI